MALTGEFPHIFSSLKPNLGVWGVADPWVAGGATPFPNGALNPPGQIYYLPPGSASGLSPALGSLQTSSGWGSGLFVKYVLYKSATNPSTVGGPAPVYYIDETLTTVSGSTTDALGTSVNMAAGWMLPNTSTGATGAGAGFTNTVLNNGGNGSYVFIALAGFIPGAISVGSTAIGDALIGAATNFTVARVAAGTAPTNKVLGWAMSAVSGGLSDVMANIIPF